MSYQDLKQALKIAEELPYFTVGTGLSAEEIKKGEEILNLKFSLQLREYYKKYNYLSFYGCELFGIDFENLDVLEGNSLAYALNERKEYGLSDKWLPIYNFDDGSLAFLDFSSLNNNNEPLIISGYYDGEKYQKIETIAEDFGAFLLSLVMEEY